MNNGFFDFNGLWSRALRWLRSWSWRWGSRQQPQLRLCESLALGERRFVSVIAVGNQKFLVGGTGNSLAMLAVLPPASPPASEPREAEDVPTWRIVNHELARQPQDPERREA